MMIFNGWKFWPYDVAAKDYVAADVVGYTDGTDDVAGKADVAEIMTWHRRGKICWRGADVSRLIIFSAVVFFLSSLLL